MVRLRVHSRSEARSRSPQNRWSTYDKINEGQDSITRETRNVEHSSPNSGFSSTPTLHSVNYDSLNSVNDSALDSWGDHYNSTYVDTSPINSITSLMPMLQLPIRSGENHGYIYPLLISNPSPVFPPFPCSSNTAPSYEPWDSPFQPLPPYYPATTDNHSVQSPPAPWRAAPSGSPYHAHSGHALGAIPHTFRDANRPVYSQVRVLLIRWKSEDGMLGVAQEVADLEEVFYDKFGYQTKTFTIPTYHSAKKLMDQVKRFFEGSEKNELLILYYAGHGGYVRNRIPFQLYSGPSDKICIPWAPIQKEIESSPSRVLLFLDSCDAAAALDRTSIKMALLACGADQGTRKPGLAGSFTPLVIHSLSELTEDYTRPVSVKYLHRCVQWIMEQREEDFSPGQKSDIIVFGGAEDDIWLDPRPRIPDSSERSKTKSVGHKAPREKHLKHRIKRYWN